MGKNEKSIPYINSPKKNTKMIRYEPLAELEGREEASYLMSGTSHGKKSRNRKIMSDNKTDLMVLELLKKVEEKKKQIGSAERPSWNTNCSFRYDPNSNASVNIQVVRDLETLVEIHAFLTSKKNAFDLSVTILKLDGEVTFKWLGFTFGQWMRDIETRINGLRIKAKKDELATLEARVNALVSPEQRRAIELEKLVQEIG